MSVNVKFVALFKNSTSTLVDKYCNESGKDVKTNTLKKNILKLKNLFVRMH